MRIKYHAMKWPRHFFFIDDECDNIIIKFMISDDIYIIYESNYTT